MPKKGDGITKRADGRYMGRAMVDAPDGPKRKTVYGKKYGEVEKKLNRLRADADLGIVFDAENQTVGEYLQSWLTDNVRDTVRESTYDSYERTVRVHLIPPFSHVKLAKLTPQHIRRLYREKLDKGLAPRTIQYAHTLLKKALKQAVRDGMIPRNPAEAVDPPQIQRDELQPLSAAQVRALLETASEAGERLEALYTVAVHTGLRQGELLGLCWEDVDLGAGTLQVKRVFSTTGAFTAPKTAKSRRKIALSRTAVEALKAHRKRQLKERIEKAGLWEDQGLVFASEVGTPLSRHNLTRSFKRLLQRAELPDVRFHDLRHTAATLLLSRNVHPKYVQEMLGHSTIAITLDTYSHVMDGMDGGTASAMDDALG